MNLRNVANIVFCFLFCILITNSGYARAAVDEDSPEHHQELRQKAKKMREHIYGKGPLPEPVKRVRKPIVEVEFCLEEGNCFKNPGHSVAMSTRYLIGLCHDRLRLRTQSRDELTRDALFNAATCTGFFISFNENIIANAYLRKNWGLENGLICRRATAQYGYSMAYENLMQKFMEYAMGKTELSDKSATFTLYKMLHEYGQFCDQSELKK